MYQGEGGVLKQHQFQGRCREWLRGASKKEKIIFSSSNILFSASIIPILCVYMRGSQRFLFHTKVVVEVGKREVAATPPLFDSFPSQKFS